MVATGLMVLKIIGLILLGILGLVLALILIVLLVPVRYRAEGSYYDEIKAKASVSWLLHIVSCNVAYDGELDMGVRIFGFRIGGREEAEEEEAAEEEAEAPEHDWNGSGTNIEPREPETVQPEPETRQAPEEQRVTMAEEIQEELEAEQKEAQEKNGASAKTKKPKPRFKMPFSFQGICDKLKEVERQKDKASAFFKDEKNQKTFRLLLKQGKALLKHILPGRLRGKARFGFDDPYTTGQVLMYISPFYSLYGKRFQIIPVFEEPVLEGEFWLKGRIRIGTILILGIRVLLDKNFRTLLKQWRK